MGKTITLKRDELVWQTRENTWTEKDYLNLLEWLKGFMDKEPNYVGDRNHQSEYRVLSQFTWEQIVKMFEYGADEDEIRIPYYYESDTTEPAYTSAIVDVIRDYIRQDNYDSDIVDEEYADDYYEDFRVGEQREQDAEVAE